MLALWEQVDIKNIPLILVNKIKGRATALLFYNEVKMDNSIYVKTLQKINEQLLEQIQSLSNAENNISDEYKDKLLIIKNTINNLHILEEEYEYLIHELKEEKEQYQSLINDLKIVFHKIKAD